MSSVPTAFGPFYEPIQHERFFEKHRRYSEVDWADFHDILTAWQHRMNGWYIKPIEVMLDRDIHGWRKKVVRWLTKRENPGHYAFTVMSVTCLLIDALSQYRYGELSSDGRHFKSFIEEFLPSYGGTTPASVWHYDHKFSSTGRELTKYSEVLWHGYRCGILHQAHAPLYCGIIPGKSPPQVEATNHARYGTSALNAGSVVGTDCPVSNICPEHLFDEVKDFLAGYLSDLADPLTAHDGGNGIRTLFKKKFSDSFGVDISTASL